MKQKGVLLFFTETTAYKSNGFHKIKKHLFIKAKPTYLVCLFKQIFSFNCSKITFAKSILVYRCRKVFTILQQSCGFLNE